MALLVTGSIGLDTVETPTGKRENVIGGSAVYFSYAASFFTAVFNTRTLFKAYMDRRRASDAISI